MGDYSTVFISFGPSIINPLFRLFDGGKSFSLSFSIAMKICLPASSLRFSKLGLLVSSYLSGQFRHPRSCPILPDSATKTVTFRHHQCVIPYFYRVKVAERVGFEPTVPVTQDSSLAGKCLKPLSHLSGVKRGAWYVRHSRPVKSAELLRARQISLNISCKTWSYLLTDQ